MSGDLARWLLKKYREIYLYMCLTLFYIILLELESNQGKLTSWQTCGPVLAVRVRSK